MTVGQQRWNPGWRMTLFFLAFLPILLSLGAWQLDRAAQKRQMETAYLDKITSLPAIATAQALTSDFQRLRLVGRFADAVFLVDNQVQAGQTGYWVLQAFDDTTSGRRLLVNRGFVAAPPVRSELPVVTAPAGEVTVLGVVWPFTGLIPLLDEDPWADGWPKRVQRLDVARMASVADAEPVEVRLEAGQPGVASSAPVLSDAKHRGYAATWFGLAAALCVLFAVYGLRRHTD